MKIVGHTGANTGSVASGAVKSVSGESVASDVPAGYKMIAPIGNYSGDDGFVFVSCSRASATSINYVIRNVASNADSGTPTFALLCIRE